MKVEISKNTWQWIMQKVGTEINQLFLPYINGEESPTVAKIRDLSKKSKIPFGYFFLNEPPVENFGILEFRTVGSEAQNAYSRDLYDTVTQMTDILEWIKQDRVTNNFEKIEYIKSISISNGIESASNHIRNILKLEPDFVISSKFNDPDKAYKNIKKLISDSGTTVMQNGCVGNNTKRPLSVEEFRAFALIDDYAPLIFINTKDSIKAKVFSLLHEFVHVCLGQNSLYNLQDDGDSHKLSDIEVFCNAVAAEILVSKELLKISWVENSDDNISDKIKSLSKVFCASSSQVLIRRLFDCDLIDKNTYFSQINIIKQEYKNLSPKKEKGSGGDFYKTAQSRIDHNFILSLNSSVNEGKTLYTEAFRLTNSNRFTFDKIIDEVIGGHNHE